MFRENIEKEHPDSTTAPATPTYRTPPLSRPTPMPSQELYSPFKQPDFMTETAQHREPVKSTASPRYLYGASQQCKPSFKVPKHPVDEEFLKPGTMYDEHRNDPTGRRGEPGEASKSLMFESVIVKQENTGFPAISTGNAGIPWASDSKVFSGWSDSYLNPYQGKKANLLSP